MSRFGIGNFVTDTAHRLFGKDIRHRLQDRTGVGFTKLANSKEGKSGYSISGPQDVAPRPHISSGAVETQPSAHSCKFSPVTASSSIYSKPEMPESSFAAPEPVPGEKSKRQSVLDVTQFQGF